MLYDLLRYPLKILFRAYFKKVELNGLDNVKKSTPAIFVATYPTSFIDAVALAMLIKTPLFFLIRATMMQRPVSRFILSSLHAIPVYCKKDGVKELHKNMNTFDRCRDVLIHNKSVVIFSEHINQNNSRTNPIKKEAARISFSAEEIFDFKLDVQIIPVSLHYHTEKIRPDLSAVFGTPIKVKSYERQYKDNPAKAINLLTSNIASSLHQSLLRTKKEENKLLAEQLISIPLPAHADKKDDVLNLTNHEINYRLPSSF